MGNDREDDMADAEPSCLHWPVTTDDPNAREKVYVCVGVCFTQRPKFVK